jgi:hypothetical protein
MHKVRTVEAGDASNYSKVRESSDKNTLLAHHKEFVNTANESQHEVASAVARRPITTQKQIYTESPAVSIKHFARNFPATSKSASAMADLACGWEDSIAQPPRNQHLLCTPRLFYPAGLVEAVHA